jgi:hypothetical protein
MPAVVMPAASAARFLLPVVSDQVYGIDGSPSLSVILGSFSLQEQPAAVAGSEAQYESHVVTAAGMSNFFRTVN